MLLFGFPGVMLTFMLLLWIFKSVVEGKSSALEPFSGKGFDVGFVGFFLTPGSIWVIFNMLANILAHLALIELHIASGIRYI